MESRSLTACRHDALQFCTQRLEPSDCRLDGLKRRRTVSEIELTKPGPLILAQKGGFTPIGLTIGSMRSAAISLAREGPLGWAFPNIDNPYLSP